MKHRKSCAADVAHGPRERALRSRSLTASIWLLIAAAPATLAQQGPDFEKAKFETVRITDSLYMLSTGIAGNVGVSIGPDGVLIIDDQYAPLAPKLRAAVTMLSDKPIRFVLNTHWHGDHAGGNEVFGRNGSVIVAQKRVRERMANPPPATLSGRAPAASPPEALPLLSFDRDLTMHLNGDELEITHVPAAHTDGDSIIRFRKANVLHMGDTFFYGMFPFIDTSSGGSYDGLVAAIERTLASVDEATRIIPGHGPLCGKKELQEYRDLLVTVRERIVKLIRAGRSQEEVIAAKPTAEFDAKWAGGFWTPDQWVARTYVDLKRSAGSTRAGARKP